MESRVMMMLSGECAVFTEKIAELQPNPLSPLERQGAAPISEFKN